MNRLYNVLNGIITRFNARTIGDYVRFADATNTIASHATEWYDSGSTDTLTKGYWLITASVQFASNATGRRGVRWVWGSSILLNTSVIVPPASGGVTMVETVGLVNITAASATFKVQVYQTSGSGLSTTVRARALKVAEID